MAFFYEDAGPPGEPNEALIVPTSEKEGFGVEADWLAGCVESRLKEFKKAIAHTAGIGSVIFSYNWIEHYSLSQFQATNYSPSPAPKSTPPKPPKSTPTTH